MVVFQLLIVVRFPPGKSYVFLQIFEKVILEILMCSSIHFASPRIFICVLVLLLFLLHPSLLKNLMGSRNIFKKVAPGKKEQIFNSSPAASVRYLVLTHFCTLPHSFDDSNIKG